MLKAWSDGDAEALDQLLPLVYEDLHRMARFYFQGESSAHTLQPTVLISELYVRLRDRREVRWDNRYQFFSFAADVMRHFLVDYARSRRALKRGGGAVKVPLTPALEVALDRDFDLVALDEALRELARVDPRQCRVVDLRYFVGLGVKEVAQVMGISVSTVKREWQTAKFWLYRRIKEGC